jgi:hypothetical protein
VVSHYRPILHRAYEAKLGAITEYFAWNTIVKDVEVFVQKCFYTAETIPGDNVLRPPSTQLHKTKPNEIHKY